MFESFGGNSGRITFFITETLGNLSSVELELRRGNDYGAIALSGHKCTPDTPFKERESHSCDIQDLAGGADYYVHLKGIRAADNVETPWSYYFRIHQGYSTSILKMCNVEKQMCFYWKLRGRFSPLCGSFSNRHLNNFTKNRDFYNTYFLRPECSPCIRRFNILLNRGSGYR